MKLTSLIGHVAEVFDEVAETGRPADRIIDHFFRGRKYLGSRDRRFIAESMYGMLRHATAIRFILDRASLEDSSKNACAVYLCFKELETPATLIEHGILSDSEVNRVSSAKEDWIVKSAKDQALLYSFPEWLINSWNGQYGDTETSSLCGSLNDTAPMTLRVNTLKISRQECKEVLFNEGIDTVETVHSPFGLQLLKRQNIFGSPAFRSGYFEMQDEGSQLLSLVVDPKPGAKVVDACAGAGGKALAMAAMMRNKGEIYAFDTNDKRIEELKKRIRRSGVDLIRTTVIEEGMIVESMSGKADYVLVDAPCSGTGTIRRNPGMKWTVSAAMVQEMSQKQLEILSLNAQYVKGNGRLVYATCSLQSEENENVAELFLQSHPEFTLIDPRTILERYGLANLAGNRYFQLLPHHHLTDGFFAAVFIRSKGD